MCDICATCGPCCIHARVSHPCDISVTMLHIMWCPIESRMSYVCDLHSMCECYSLGPCAMPSPSYVCICPYPMCYVV